MSKISAWCKMLFMHLHMVPPVMPINPRAVIFTGCWCCTLFQRILLIAEHVTLPKSNLPCTVERLQVEARLRSKEACVWPAVQSPSAC